MNRLLYSIILIFLGLSVLHSQSTISAAGVDVKSNVGEMNFTIGQVFYSQNKSNDFSEYQGVQQPYEISIVSTIFEADNIKIAIKTYPNPTHDYLIVNTENISNLQNMEFKLFDFEGKFIKRIQPQSKITNIDFFNYSSGVYFLNVVESKKTIKIFKIVKN